ncbi:SIMPL domain-containing protein [bacterium]|nr:SIMPL domain-containing protein [bacterium]MDB4568372.1 SIMPL domain-containing protein [Akkermansiaceae bacterium]
MSALRNHQNIIVGFIVAAGIAIGGFFISKTLYNAKVALNTAEAKGLAERRVEANRANWTIGFSVKGKTKDEIPNLYREAEAIQKRLTALLKENGFTDEEITLGIIDYGSRQYRNEDQVLTDEDHFLNGSISIETANVRSVAPARGVVNKLISEGISITNRTPTYSFNGLNAIKPDMLREATKNARIAANEFASNAGVEVGGIRTARQGSFFIRDAGSESSDSYKIEKDVRVVTTITFFLTD